MKNQTTTSKVVINKENPTVKTTINIDKKTWENFSIKVIKEKGGRKKNDVIEALIKEYVGEK